MKIDIIYPETFVYTCVVGTMPTGNLTITCTINGTFDSELAPICTGMYFKYYVTLEIHVC